MLLWLISLLGLVLVFYVHSRVGQLSRYAWITRAGLLLVGTGFGTVCALAYSAIPGAQWAAFLLGFDLVHLPPAVVLTIKTLRLRGY